MSGQTNLTRVLLVEDSETDAVLISAHLRLDGRFSVDRADTLEAARQMLKYGDPVDVVTLDLNLPDSMGLDTFTALHGEFPDIPVVILSGHEDETLATLAVNQGAQDYVTKAELQDSRHLVRALLFGIERHLRRRAERDYLVMKRDMAMAQRIQQHLLPSSSPQIHGFDIAGVCQPADETGGDFFDFIPSAKTPPSEPDPPISTWDLLVADVSSHGFAPALIMVGTRRMLRTCAPMNNHVGEILTIANRAVAEDTLDEQFVTMFFARLNPKSRQLEFSAAGHQAHLLHPDGTATVLSTCGVPLGLEPDTEYEVGGNVQLQSGDLVLLMTDGAYEASPAEGDQIGHDQILALIHQLRHLASAEILARLLDLIRAHCHPGPVQDDVTFVLIRVL